MTEEEIQTSLNTIKSNTENNTQLLAQLYTVLMTEMNDAVTIARNIVATIDDSEEGIVELKQLLQIMDGNFIKKANQVIQKATSETVE